MSLLLHISATAAPPSTAAAAGPARLLPLAGAPAAGAFWELGQPGQPASASDSLSLNITRGRAPLWRLAVVGRQLSGDVDGLARGRGRAAPLALARSALGLGLGLGLLSRARLLPMLQLPPPSSDMPLRRGLVVVRSQGV